MEASLSDRNSLALKRTNLEVSELRADVSVFLKEKENPLLEHLERKDFFYP
jgi:hypothetical protein